MTSRKSPDFALPEPGIEETEHSQKLSIVIKQQIIEAGGWISFDHYMQLALYSPGLGYYSAGLQKFGEHGDFITSPEVSPLFGKTLARPIAKILADIPAAKIIEFGAGSGKLAVDILRELQSLNQLPEKYLIVELSADLRQRQGEFIQQQIPELEGRVEWLSSLPESPINGLVIANEVLDAMPVKRFMIRSNRTLQLGVSISDEALKLTYQEADEAFNRQLQALQINHIGEYDYCSEINLNIAPWIKSLSQCINQGAVYIIDYGYPRSEFYLEQRHMGTFIGYYRHRSIDAPLWYPGLQDLTAFVDFTSVAEAALENGFDVDGYTSQGAFLINAGLADIVEQTACATEIQRLQTAQQMKTLSLPGEMGERFKVIGLSKGLDKNIPGFELYDLRHSL